MVNAKKHKANKHKNQKEETNEEFEERVINQMQTGFKWSHEDWTIREIVKGWDNGKGILVDPDYQRKKVWKNPKNKALIETILHHGGQKIPVITLRELPKGKFEIVDGKQRILSAIVPFCNDEFRLNGVYEDKLSGRKFSDIEKEHPKLHTAFMGQTVPVQIAKNMNEEEARIYFIQINTSGVNMEIGEQIHGMQGTPLIKTIEELLNHKIWNNVQNIKRYGEYAYTSRMLLHVVTNEEMGENIVVYTNKQLLANLERYYEINLPKSAVTSLKKTWDFLDKVFTANKMCLNVREFFPLFIFAHRYLGVLKQDQFNFSKFISGLYLNIHEGNEGVFRVIKDQPNQPGYKYNSKYYSWYCNTLHYLYAKYLKGASWDEIQQLSIKE